MNVKSWVERGNYFCKSKKTQDITLKNFLCRAYSVKKQLMIV